MSCKTVIVYEFSKSSGMIISLCENSFTNLFIYLFLRILNNLSTQPCGAPGQESAHHHLSQPGIPLLQI